MSFATRIFIVIKNVIYVILYPFLFYELKSGRRKCVPPITDDLLKISASKLSDLIRQKKLKSENIVQAYIKRIKEVNPLINAVVEERFEEALKEAKSVDDYLRTTSLTANELQRIKPFLGVPITVKESCMLSGMSYSVGSLSRSGIKAETDSEAVAKMKLSGAIPLLVSNTPEYCIGWICNNLVTGATNNPYDISLNSGGSSGGEAALIGSGASILGIGSDVGGSLRYPAMCCGIFAHKPSAKLVSVKGHCPLPTDKRISEYLTLGPLTRYAEDLKPALSVMCGKLSADLRLNEEVDLSKIRVYYMKAAPRSLTNPPVRPEIKEAISKSVSYLEQNNNTKIIHERCFEEYFSDIFEGLFFQLINIEGVPKLSKGENGKIMVELLKAFFCSSNISIEFLIAEAAIEYKDLWYDPNFPDKIQRMKEKIIGELRDNAVLICPTFHKPTMKKGEIFFHLEGLPYLLPVNLLGLPGTNVPCGRTSDGLPIGLQVIAGPNQDRLCLAVAVELEKCFGGWIPPSV